MSTLYILVISYQGVWEIPNIARTSFRKLPLPTSTTSPMQERPAMLSSKHTHQFGTLTFSRKEKLPIKHLLLENPQGCLHWVVTLGMILVALRKKSEGNAT